MKAILISLLLGLIAVANAQFYAPDTQYHDISQRTFVVEAARVLAWYHCLTGNSQIAEITFEQVTTAAAHDTEWKVRWTDASGKLLRERQIQYPESQLLEGPDFYRKIFNQIADGDWGISTAPPDNASSAFWQGADLAGLSRLEAIAAAHRTITDKKISRPADAARIAGILTQGSTSILGTQVTLDSLLLSRAAAWLCISELMSREEFDAQWMPILFLAGRENAARAKWATLPKRNPDKRGAAERLWATMMGKPTPHDFFAFVGKPANRSVAMPVFAYLNRMGAIWNDEIASAIPKVYDEAFASRLFDYMPSIASRGGVASGHLASEAPGYFLAAWEKAMADYTPLDREDTSYRQNQAKIKKGASEEEAPDHLKRLSSLLNLGSDTAAGKLVPTGIVTALDLLGYGWEFAGMQFAYQNEFLEDRLGDPDSAKEIADAAYASLIGADVLMSGAKHSVAGRPLKDLRRVQFLGSSRVQYLIATKVPEWQKPADTLIGRTWLWKTGAFAAVENLFLYHAPEPEAKKAIERLIDEGGPLAISRIWTESGSDEVKSPDAIKRFGLRDRILEGIPWLIEPKISEGFRKLREGTDFLGAAQAFEKLTWDNEIAIRTDAAFYAYLRANAIDAAKKFYDQVEPFVADRVSFSNQLGPMRFALAWWEGDDTAMQRAMKDSSTYSWSDLNVQATYALHVGDVEQAREILRAMSERYEKSSNETRSVEAYLALVPALRDAAHPDHGKALDQFPHIGSWNWTQLVLARQAKLTKEETIRFLGGDHPMEANEGFLTYFRGDKEGLGRACADELTSGSRLRCTAALLSIMYNELAGIRPPSELPNLKPAGFKTLSQVVEEAMTSSGVSEAEQVVDFSKFKTAEQFWAALEKLKEPPRQRKNTPEEMRRSIVAWLQHLRGGSAVFVKTFPDDPHRHAARLIGIDAGFQLRQLGDRNVGLPEEKELQEILTASDSDQAARGDAEFFILMLQAQSLDINSPHTLPPFQQALTAYMDRYPSHARVNYVASLLFQLLNARETPSTEALLKKLSTSGNANVAAQAKGMLQLRAQMADLKKKPIELQFKASDGRDVDLARLRGKVVLIDFWASWCGPCMSEAPAVVSLYKKLRDEGFEIVGVSLDENREAMDAAMKQLGMTWPQAFDGKGFDGDICHRFGIRAIPSTWIFDRKGLLRETGLRGDDLETRVRNLLRER